MPKTGIEIIYEDDDILVVNKPTDVSVTKDRSGAAQLSDILAKQLGQQLTSQLRLVYRLDKHTSGVMLLARNLEAQSRYSSYFAKSQAGKTYLALATGVVTKHHGTITAGLTHNRKNPALMTLARKGRAAAITEWKLLADFGLIVLLAVSPRTDRTHQIRVHLPSVGLPLAIDPLYGSSRPLFLSYFKPGYRLAKKQTEKSLIDRLTLHAYQLEFPNPEPNRPTCFVAGLDKKFKATIKMLTKHNPKGPDAFLDPEDFSKILATQEI